MNDATIEAPPKLAIAEYSPTAAALADLRARFKAEREAEEARLAEVRAAQEAELRAQREAEEARAAEQRKIEAERQAAERAEIERQRAELEQRQREQEEREAAARAEKEREARSREQARYEYECRLEESAPQMQALLSESLDLVPRMSDDDPMAPALAEWCRRVRMLLHEIGVEPSEVTA